MCFLVLNSVSSKLAHHCLLGRGYPDSEFRRLYLSSRISMHGSRRHRDAVSWASHPHAPLCLWRAAAPVGASTRPTPRQRDPESTRPAPRQCRRRVDAALFRQRTACVDAPPPTLTHRAYVNAALPASTRARVDAAGSASTQAARQRGPRALTQAPRQRGASYVNAARVR